MFYKLYIAFHRIASQHSNKTILYSSRSIPIFNPHTMNSNKQIPPKSIPPAPAPTPSKDGSGAASAAEQEENLYLPSFIRNRPFYINDTDDATSSDYLKHQRVQKKAEESKWYDRGRKAGPAATKYRKGACENCGAMTHKQKDCLSRPRARGAKWTGKDIQADELVQDVKMGWDAKRDRWNGYEAKDYLAVVEEHDEMEALKKEAQRAAKGLAGDEEEDAEKYAEGSDMSKHQSTATRQLRIREDTAKYLLNLDLDSAKYNPKVRAFIDPGAANDSTAEMFAEQEFVRASGDTSEFGKAQRYAWELQETSGDMSMHLQANPTAAAIQRKLFEDEEVAMKREKDMLLKEMYGVSEENAAAGLPEALRRAAVTENEEFVEYDEAGLVKGVPRGIVVSRYEEDVYPQNHTSVFGSWWADFKWGYACCHSFIKNSYCTGAVGIGAWEASEKQPRGEEILTIEGAPEGEDESEKEMQEKKQEKKDGGEPRRTKVKKRTAADMMDGVTEEELEEYRKRRTAADDPMAKFLGKDDLL